LKFRSKAPLKQLRNLSLSLFLLYINDLPKIINKTSAPVIFADDTSILVAHSDPIDFEKTLTWSLKP